MARYCVEACIHWQHHAGTPLTQLHMHTSFIPGHCTLSTIGNLKSLDTADVALYHQQPKPLQRMLAGFLLHQKLQGLGTHKCKTLGALTKTPLLGAVKRVSHRLT